MRFYKIIILFLYSIILLLPITSHSQDFKLPPYPLQKQYQRAASRTVNMILENYAKHLNYKERKILSNINIEITRSYLLSDVCAIDGPNGKSIRISLGWIFSTEFLQDAALITMFGLSDEKVLNEYIEYLVEICKKNSKNYRLGYGIERYELAQHFAIYANIPNNNLRYLYSLKEFQQQRIIFKIHTFALVLAHELAHHFLGHLDSVSKCDKSKEIKADNYALKLMMQADYNPIFATWPFIFFAATEYHNGFSETHPAAICRAKKFIKNGIIQGEKDPNFKKYLKAHNLTAQWKSFVDRFDEFAPNLDNELCNKEYLEH